MKTTMKHFKTMAGARGLALCLVSFMMLMSVLPMIGQAQAPIVAPGALTSPTATMSQIDINGPAGSGRFGTSVTALPNGNIVVTDPFYDITSPMTIVDVGAVYLYNGATGTLISKLTGSFAHDQVGSGGVTVLANGNYVVSSPGWNDSRGAATWGNGATGISGPVTAANSLVGSIAFDEIGFGVTALTNGNYVVISPLWSNGAISGVGAATWGNGATGISGPVTPANSLVGSTAGDSVGSNGMTALTNGNYVVISSFWSNSAMVPVGAATWGNGATGISGPISSANSLVGSTTLDRIGNFGVTALINGNYVVKSASWNDSRGAATWGNGTTGISGLVSAANSLVGSSANDQVGVGVTALTNGNYVVSSPFWSNGAIRNAGAATWSNGATGISGLVSSANSLVGSTTEDFVGSGVTALTNGNYVVRSAGWSNGGMFHIGAVTWGNGTTGISGLITLANSLVGSTSSDGVGLGGVTALANGNYVVSSPDWNNGAIVFAGAATWGNGATGISGPVTPANSLVGSTSSDSVSASGVTALTNGNYVVCSEDWNNGAIVSVGAATWGNGATGISGPVTLANSLVGSSGIDLVGINGATALTNGNYVVSSSFWSNGGIFHIGAATWGNGATGISGPVTPANSLVGSTSSDGVGGGGAIALTNGNYVVRSAGWDNGSIVDAGAITYGMGSNGATVGPITASNSVLGTAPGGGFNLVFAYDSVNRQLVVGRPDSNIVTLFRVIEFDVCLQDDYNPNTSVAFNTQTGSYIFCAGGAQYSGTGTVTRRGNTYTLQHNTGDRRVQVSLDVSANRATATLQKLGAGGGTFSLTDRDIRNDTCPCLAH